MKKIWMRYAKSLRFGISATKKLFYSLLTKTTPSVIIAPLRIIRTVIDSLNNIQAANTVTSGSKYKKAPTFADSKSLREYAQIT